MSSLNKNIFYTFLTQFPNLFFGILSGIFITRILGSEGKGVLTIFQTNIDFLVLVLGISVNSGLVYFIASKKISYNRLLGISCYLILLGTFIISIITVMIMAGFEMNFLFPDDYNSTFFLFYLSTTFLINLTKIIIIGILQGFKNFQIINWLTIALGGLNTVIFGLLFYIFHIQLFDIDIKMMFESFLLINFISLIAYIFLYAKHHYCTPSFKLNYHLEVKPFFKYIGIGHISQLINFLNYRFDIWIITYYCSMELLGLYSLAVNIAQFMWMISNPIATVLMPYLSDPKNDNDKKITMLKIYSKINTSLVLILSIMIFLLSDFLVPLLYGIEFTSAVLPLKILLIGIFFSSIYKPFSTYIAGKNQLKYNLIATSGGLFFTIVLGLSLIPKWNIIGASIATNISYIVTATFVFYAAMYKLKLPISNYFILTLSDIRQLYKKITIYEKRKRD
ncbi:MAG: hypothetical protein COA57_01015 [Flavobacteriales bacterium]|nr:MAG: hypothetical protein COA57_01015 [Flavobacteriales bacterium]